MGTNGSGGGKFTDAAALAQAIEAHWPSSDQHRRFVVLTGGEPLLQVDEALTLALHERGFTIAVETNGTVVPPPGIDWLCMSPKAGTQVVVRQGQELKLVFPQAGADPQAYAGLAFEHFYLQPMDGPNAATHTAQAIDFCQRHPHWSLSVQTHKVLGIR